MMVGLVLTATVITFGVTVAFVTTFEAIPDIVYSLSQEISPELAPKLSLLLKPFTFLVSLAVPLYVLVFVVPILYVLIKAVLLPLVAFFTRKRK